MTDTFLTKGLEGNRYLKAIRLIEQFEDDIRTILREFDQRMVDEQPDLFDPSTTLDMRTRRDSNTIIAYQRINHSMNGPNAPDSGQKLNVHLYWVSANEYGRRDIDGVIRALGYKIKEADPDIDTRVAEQTRADDWPVETADNPFDASTVFYRHVSSVSEIEETMDTLVDHFSEFGGEYAIN